MPLIREIIEFLSDREYETFDGFREENPLERARPILEAGPNDITFCSSVAREPQELLTGTHAALIIVDKGIPVDKSRLAQAGVQVIVYSDNARLDFIRVVERFFAKPRPHGIHPTAVIPPDARIAPDVYIGAYCVIGEVTIGQGTVIHSGVHIYDGVSIGQNVVIHSGCIIGSDGFGFERTPDGSVKKFLHIGSVIIEDEVELQADCHVSRGTLGDTIIKRGAKFDSGCHIAHNVVVGEYCLVAAHTMIAGGVVIGNRVWIGPSSAIMDRIQIGSDVFVGLGTVVTKSIPDGIAVMGAPAKPVEDYKKILRALSALANEGA